MGIRCNVSELPADEFDLLIKGVDVPMSSAEPVFLDQDWIDIYPILQDLGKPLNLAITGDNLLPQYPTPFDLLDENGQGSDFVGLASPSLVHEVAAAFAALPPEEIDRIERLDNYWHFGGSLEALKELYCHVAERGNALFIMMA